MDRKRPDLYNDRTNVGEGQGGKGQAKVLTQVTAPKAHSWPAFNRQPKLVVGVVCDLVYVPEFGLFCV